MGVDVMIAGHTHKLSVRQGAEGGLYINPGSVRSLASAAAAAAAGRQELSAGPENAWACGMSDPPCTTFRPLPAGVQATGCASVLIPEEPEASFVLIDVQGNKIVTYSYILESKGEGEVRPRPIASASSRAKRASASPPKMLPVPVV
jgi:hypothetical protein